MVTSIFSFVAQSLPSSGCAPDISCPCLGCLLLSCCPADIQALLSLPLQVRATAPASHGILVTFLFTVPATDKKQGEKRKICCSLWLEGIIHHGGEGTVAETLHGCGCRNRKLLVHKWADQEAKERISALCWPSHTFVQSGSPVHEMIPPQTGSVFPSHLASLKKSAPTQQMWASLVPWVFLLRNNQVGNQSSTLTHGFLFHAVFGFAGLQPQLFSV